MKNSPLRDLKEQKSFMNKNKNATIEEK